MSIIQEHVKTKQKKSINNCHFHGNRLIAREWKGNIKVLKHFRNVKRSINTIDSSETKLQFNYQVQGPKLHFDLQFLYKHFNQYAHKSLNNHIQAIVIYFSLIAHKLVLFTTKVSLNLKC
jgi:hypothetical protein